MEELLDHDRLKLALQNRPFRFFQQISSTNNVAEKWALEGVESGAVVVAEEQLSGRGRLMRTWQTPPQQAIAMSVIVRPKIQPQEIYRLTIAAGLSVATGIEQYVERVDLKWPNDVLIMGKKVCGILAEAHWTGNQLGAVIIGIGINVRVPFRDSSLEAIATSIEEHATETVDRPTLIAAILNRLDEWMPQIQSDIVIEAYRQRLATIGQNVVLNLSSGSLNGLAIDTDEDGALLVKTDDGRVHRVLVGDIVQ